MNDIPVAARPFIGIIVEGGGEYATYPMLINRIIEQDSVFSGSPVNANGINNIIKSERFIENMNDLLSATKPLTVLIALDYCDRIGESQKDFSNCIELIEHIKSNIKQWKNGYQNHPKYQPIPEKYTIVLQVNQFENWILADIESLSKTDIKKQIQSNIANRDEIKNPCKYLNVNTKTPKSCKKIFRKLDIENIQKNSRSFKKLAKEVMQAYALWQSKISEKKFVTTFRHIKTLLTISF